MKKFMIYLLCCILIGIGSGSIYTIYLKNKNLKESNVILQGIIDLQNEQLEKYHKPIIKDPIKRKYKRTDIIRKHKGFN